MGTDIHAFIEDNPFGNGFSLFAELNLSRDYNLFGRLAGIRGGCAVFETRGLPKDISCELRWKYDDESGDVHHPSWLINCEVWEILRRHGEHNDLHIVGEILKHLGNGRFIFWFDN